MKILVRNEEHVSDCVLVTDAYLPREDLLNHPQVQQFLHGREVRYVSPYRPIQNSEVMSVDLYFRQPR